MYLECTKNSTWPLHIYLILKTFRNTHIALIHIYANNISILLWLVYVSPILYMREIRQRDIVNWQAQLPMSRNL